MVDDKENQRCSFKIADHHHNHKVLVKLKIPKHEEDVDEDDHQSTSSQENNHDQNTKICQVCNKVFTSGKALGGHMRIHVEGSNSKELLISKKKKKLKAKQPIKFKKQKVCGFGKNENFIDDGGDKRKKPPKCVLCGKNFPSMKSLFGHMRCHPERDWRGIEPPPAAKISSSPRSSAVSNAEPEIADDQVDSGGAGGAGGDDANDDLTMVGLAESLPGWLVTAKRGRKVISSSEEDEEEDEICIAAQNILLLRDADSFESSLTHKQKIDEFETTNSSSLSYKIETDVSNRVLELKRQRNMEESPDGLNDDQPLMQEVGNDGRFSTDGEHVQGLELGDIGKGKSSAVGSVDWPHEYAENDSTDNESDGELLMMIKSKKKRKRMKLRDLDQMKDAMNPSSVPDKYYRCSTCGKCFSTHQALGGHRSSHNKSKIVSNNSIDESESFSAASEDDNLANTISQVEEHKESEGAASSKLVVEGGTHECNICNKIFHSGQALGGHKRCHWSGTMEAQSSLTMSPGEISQTGRRILDFDLNEAPPMEDHEANIISEQLTGYGYASSSYDSVA